MVISEGEGGICISLIGRVPCKEIKKEYPCDLFEIYRINISNTNIDYIDITLEVLRQNLFRSDQIR